MEVICQPVGPFQSNCYIVMENGQCLVIDPGDDANQISQMVKALGLKVDGILLTHAHFDHIGGVDALMEEFNAPCYINPAEIEALQHPVLNGSNSFMGVPPMILKTKPIAFKEGENKIGSFDVMAYYAPGHSIGSTMFAIGNNLFTGDVLFQNSIGRVDLPGGSAQQMRESLNFLKSLKQNYVVYPGHGPSTTLFYEQSHNPYLLYGFTE